MKRLPVTLVVLASASLSMAQFSTVVPNDYATTFATSSFLGPMANAQRTYQLLIHESQMTSLVGLQLNGLSWRLPTSAGESWPASDVSFTNFDIYLSESVTPAFRSLTFAHNVVGTQTQVRSGSLTVPANSFTAGNTPNDFGLHIAFDEWTYAGGHLLIEIRHNGFTGTSRSVEAIGTTTTGYGSLFSAAWTGSYTGVTGSQGNFAVTELTAVPEPGTLLAIGAGLGLLAARRRRRAA